MKPIEQLQLATSLYMTTRLRCLLNMHALWYLKCVLRLQLILVCMVTLKQILRIISTVCE